MSEKKTISGRIDEVSLFIRSCKSTMSTYISNKGVPTSSNSNLSSIIENINKIDSKTGNETITILVPPGEKFTLLVFNDLIGTKDLGVYNLSSGYYSKYGEIYFFDLNGSSISRQGKVYLKQSIPYSKELQIQFYGNKVALNDTNTGETLSGNYNVSIEFNLWEEDI